MNHGLHTFIVPIRDPNTHLPLPGVIVGDMGEKIALNGVDNGFVMFDNYRVARQCLLNRTASVTEDGTYKTRVKNQSKRFGKRFAHITILEKKSSSEYTQVRRWVHCQRVVPRSHL